MAQAGISGVACQQATGVTMRPECSIFELREIASGVAIAVFGALLFKLPFGAQIGQGVPAASCTHHVLKNAAGSQAAMACEA